MVAAVDALQTLFRALLTPGVHLGGRNIAYDLALVKLGAHSKFGEDWSNGVYFYTGHTHTHTHRFTFIYKISLFRSKLGRPPHFCSLPTIFESLW
jgi:hypothetical protein